MAETTESNPPSQLTESNLPSDSNPQLQDKTTEDAIKPASVPNETIDTEHPKPVSKPNNDAKSAAKPTAAPKSKAAKTISTNKEPGVISVVSTSAPSEPITQANDPPPYTPPVEEVFIAVMGQTGTGKSTFVNNATGSQLEVGYTMEPCTQDIFEARTLIDGQLVTLIDTPGFDDSGRDDAEILKCIGDHLKAAYDNDTLLRGVVYLHRITDNRIGGSSLRSLGILKELCGHKYYNNIALATTMWSEIADAKEGARREEELKTNMDYWKAIIAAGAKVFRHDRQEKSAKEIVRELLPKKDMPTQFQEELAQHGIMSKTSAGTLVTDHLKRMQKKHEAEIGEMQNQIANLVLKKEESEIREKELRGEIDKMKEDMKKLQTPVDAMGDTRPQEFLKRRRVIKSKPGWNRCVTQ